VSDAEEFIYNPGFDSAFDAITNFRSLYTAKIEVEHAKSIIKSRDPWKTLKNFAYISNYLQLAKTEYLGSRLKLYFSPSAKKRYGRFAILYDNDLFLVSNPLSFSRLFTDMFFNPTSVNRSTTSRGVIPLKKGN